MKLNIRFRFVMALMMSSAAPFINAAGYETMKTIPDAPPFSLLAPSIRAGATDIFAIEPNSGDAINLTRHPSENRYPAWSPDGQWISFRVTDTAFWRDADAYAEAQKRRDTLRPVWVMKADGSNPRPIEALRYPCATDGSRAVWRPGAT
jgi:hypothetical protein